METPLIKLHHAYTGSEDWDVLLDPREIVSVVPFANDTTSGSIVRMRGGHDRDQFGQVSAYPVQVKESTQEIEVVRNEAIQAENEGGA